MNVSKLNGGRRSEEELEAAMKVLAATIRDAGECLLDLQQAVIKLRLARDPRLATTVDQAAGDCLKRAMRR